MAYPSKQILFIFFIICTYFKYEGNCEINEIQKSKEWDFLTFTQQWPSVACISWTALNPSHHCNITKNITTWTVHGIWPSSYKSNDPSFCNSSWIFREAELDSIKPELFKFWPNLYADTPESQLWAHEWEKHGTCAATLKVLRSELFFFKQGLKWVKQYNMLNILNDSNVHPSSDVPVSIANIETSIKLKLGVTPYLGCEYISKTKTHYLYQIEICFSKKLKLIDCPENLRTGRFSLLGSEPCPKDADIWYPPIKYENTCQNSRQMFFFTLLKTLGTFSFL